MQAAIIFPLLFLSGVALAGPAAAGSAAQDGSSCGRLITEAECQQHRQTLAGLTDPDARHAYLSSFQAMMREREVMCGGKSERRVLARAQYR